MPEKILRLVVLAAWTAFFLWLITLGQAHLARLLHPKLWWLLRCGIVILVLLFAATLASPVRQQPALSWRWPPLLILLIPLAFATFLPTARFNAHTFAQRTIQAPADDSFRPDLPPDPLAPEKSPDEPNDLQAIEDETGQVSLTRLNTEPETFVGKEVEVLCQSLRDPQLPEDMLICYRFRITCCAADAMPVYILLRTTGQPLPNNDSWLRVRGRLSLFKNRGFTLPLVTADTLTVAQEPRFPFLF